MSTSKPLLIENLLGLISDVGASNTPQQKAAALADVIDAYVVDLVSKLTGSSTVTGTVTGVTAEGPPTGPYPIVSQPVTASGVIAPGGLVVN